MEIECQASGKYFEQYLVNCLAQICTFLTFYTFTFSEYTKYVY